MVVFHMLYGSFATSLRQYGFHYVFRCIALAAFIFLLTVPASGMKTALYPLPSATLAAAVEKLRARDYSAALQLAEASPDCGIRNFIAGMAAFKAGQWDNAQRYLSAASGSFDLLTDYILYHQGQALQNLNRLDEALTVFLSLQKRCPESYLLRPTFLLIADIQFQRKDFSAALTSYQKFIESYPAGSDALRAQYKIALCRDALGDKTGAVKVFRTLWITSPGSPLAAKADEDSQRLAAAGAVVAPFTPDELYRRATTLFDLKKFSQAVTAFRAIPRTDLGNDFLARIDFKTAQSLFNARHIKEAEQLFAGLAADKTGTAPAAEAAYWLARCKDRNNRNSEEAFNSFMKLADRWPTADEADNALLQAAYIRKSQKRWVDVSAILKRLNDQYPESSLKPIILWESGWSAYQSGNWQGATEWFRRLSDGKTGRDRALYWLARAQVLAGDTTAAQTTYATLIRDFPLSYYSMAYWQGQKQGDELLPHLAQDTLDTLPLPPNFERAKALIGCGLFDEARKELSASRSKNRDRNKALGLARLYLEMGDYNGAYNLMRSESLHLTGKEGQLSFALQYPLAFREIVSAHASRNGLTDSLVYAIIRAESSFSPTAVSPAGAIGLMQLLPATAAQVAKTGIGTMNAERLGRPDQNIPLGISHFKDLMLNYRGDLIAAIAAYNAGGTAVDRWLRDFGDLPASEFIENIPYAETREYVKKVLTSTALYARFYGLSDGNSPDSPLSPPASPAGQL